MFTLEQCEEFVKCARDPVHFAENYLKTIHPARGSVRLELYDYQKEAIRKMSENKRFLGLQSRQSGKSTQIIASALHEVTFGSYKTIFLITNKFESARELLSRLKFAHERLPDFMQQKVVVNNKSEFELENGSRVIAIGAGSMICRLKGFAISSVYIDEAAFCENMDYFLGSIYPCISVENGRLAIYSTYKKDTEFQTLWDKTLQGKTNFEAMKVIWSQVPGRNQWWREKQIQMMGLERFQEEFECGPPPEERAE